MRVLIVCTGNICRSPTGEVVLRARVRASGLDDRVVVASAGTWGGKVGEPADPRAVAAAARRGYDMSALRAAVVGPEHFATVDLMLGMTGAHVQQLEAMRPPQARSEIRRYLDLTPGLEERDVPDPYLGTDADFEHALDLVERGVDGVVAHLRSRLASA
ncbi:MAG: low molecular weight protein-tyrosine-phosphatase [Planctomycetota bacterium]